MLRSLTHSSGLGTFGAAFLYFEALNLHDIFSIVTTRNKPDDVKQKEIFRLKTILDPRTMAGYLYSLDTTDVKPIQNTQKMTG
jgi:hypothetical protein